jgi:acyl-CoA synthetase (AMP-forming)/AMP-acid ligase II
MIYDDAIQTLADLSRIQADRYPESNALVCQDQTLTYRQLHLHSNRVADALQSVGIQAGSRVAFLAKDSLQGYEILLACAKIGAVLVPIGWRLSAPEISYILQDAEVKFLFTSSQFLASIESFLPQLNSIETIVTLDSDAQTGINYETWLLDRSEDNPTIAIEPETIAVQLYTSGTTGHPKGVQLAHYSFFAIAKAFARQNQRWIGWQQQDKSLLALPIFHIGGLWWAVQGLVAGAETFLLETFIPKEALQTISTHGITKAGLVPAMIQAMLREPSCQQTDFSALDTIVYGGSPIAETLLHQAIATFACDFVQIYGMTETGNCAVSLAANDHLTSDRLKAAGKAFPGVSIAIVNSQHQVLPPHEIGEICLQSPANMIGYWKLPEATASTLIDGWIHTGDAGYLDEDGYVYICDRIKDMICYASENVYPTEVENVLYQHPAIAEVAVIGVPDPQWGETVKAMVVLKPEMTLTALDLINFGRGKLANFKLPRSVEFIDTLPRTPSGKVQKGQLRKKYWQGYARQVN